MWYPRRYSWIFVPFTLFNLHSSFRSNCYTEEPENETVAADPVETRNFLLFLMFHYLLYHLYHLLGSWTHHEELSFWRDWISVEQRDSSDTSSDDSLFRLLILVTKNSISAAAMSCGEDKSWPQWRIWLEKAIPWFTRMLKDVVHIVLKESSSSNLLTQ